MIEATGLRCLRERRARQDIRAELETAVYRVVQEALTNVVKRMPTLERRASWWALLS